MRYGYVHEPKLLRTTKDFSCAEILDAVEKGSTANFIPGYLVGQKLVPITATDPFKGRHFPGDIILMAVRWYLRYPLSFEQVSELLAERGVKVDPSCVWRLLLLCPVAKS